MASDGMANTAIAQSLSVAPASVANWRARFAEDGVKQVVRDVFIPWYHAYRLFVQSANALEGASGKPFDRDAQCALASTNTMDRWILASAHSLLRFMRQEVDG